MQEKLLISALQLDSTIGAPQANLEYLDLAIKKVPKGTDVVVLPELFSTGYISDLEQARKLAEPVDGPTMTHVKKLARRNSCAICGTFLAKDGDKLCNRAFFVEPNGDAVFYDKRHLFSLSDEASIVSPGLKLAPVMRFRGWNFSMAVCYDVRFPAWVRNQGMKYDVLLVPANWPQKRSYAWTHLLQARAIENQAYIVGANRSGSDEFGVYDNETYIYDYMGKRIAEASGVCISAELNRTALEKFRAGFPVWKDADQIELK